MPNEENVNEVDETTELQDGVPPDEDLDAEMIAAAKAARESVGKGEAHDDDAAKAADAELRNDPDAKKKAAKPEPKKDEEEDEDAGLSNIERELKKREVSKGKLAAAEAREAEANRKLQEADAMMRRLEEQAQRLKAQEERFARIHTLPVDQKLRELGVTADEFIEHSLKEKDPAYQAERRFEDRFSKLERALEEKDQKISKLESVAQGYEQQATEAAVRQSHEQFLAAIPEDSPARVIWTNDYILKLAYETQKAYEAKTGRKPSIASLSEHVHIESLKKAQKLASTAPAQESAPSEARKSRANGSRALTTRDASVRRAPPVQKSVDDMDEDEMFDHLVAVAKEEKAKFVKR